MGGAFTSIGSTIILAVIPKDSHSSLISQIFMPKVAHLNVEALLRTRMMVHLAALILLLGSGCDDGERSGNSSSEASDAVVTASQANSVARAYLKEMSIEDGRLTVESIDMGDRWRLLYNRPEGSTGAPIIVVVNKKSGKVVHMETEQ
jgi:hypothetical protein